MIYIGLIIIVVNAPQEPAAKPPAGVVQEHPTETPRMVREPGMIYVDCPTCGWEGGYDNPTSAKQGSASHRAWCRRGHGRKSNLFG